MRALDQIGREARVRAYLGRTPSYLLACSINVCAQLKKSCATLVGARVRWPSAAVSTTLVSMTRPISAPPLFLAKAIVTLPCARPSPMILKVGSRFDTTKIVPGTSDGSLLTTAFLVVVLPFTPMEPSALSSELR